MFALARNLGATALLLALFALAPPCASAAQVFPSVSPTVLHGPSPWQITYSVEFDAGPVDEQIPISVFAGTFVPVDPILDGPGTLTADGRQLITGSATCGSGFGSIELGTGGGSAWILNLPAGMRTVVNLPVLIDRNFALGEQTYDDVRFSVNNRPLALPSPVLAVPREVPLTLRVGRKTATVGQRVRLIGRTTPLLAGQGIDLRAAYGRAPYVAKPGFTVKVARVRVAKDGTFSYSDFRPTRPGRWSASAVFDSHDPDFLDSAMSGCFPGVIVTR